jgi:hypothetical protein
MPVPLNVNQLATGAKFFESGYDTDQCAIGQRTGLTPSHKAGTLRSMWHTGGGQLTRLKKSSEEGEVPDEIRSVL